MSNLTQTKVAAGNSVTENVKQMYTEYPFPPNCRRGTYKVYGQFLRQLAELQGIDLKNKKILDAGCGTGVMLSEIAAEIPEAQFWGVDLTPASLDKAKALAKEKGLTNINFQIQNLLQPTLTETFDVIYTWGVLHHTPNPEVVFKNVASLLNKGGIIRIGVYGDYGNFQRRIQNELIKTIVPDAFDYAEQIKATREWIAGDAKYQAIYCEPAVDINDDAWVVDEFLHIHEDHIKLSQAAGWFEDMSIEPVMLTDYYNRNISLDIADHSTDKNFIERVRALPLVKQLHVIDMLSQPYWISLIGRKR